MTERKTMYVSKIEDPEYFTIDNMAKLMELFHGEVNESFLPEMDEMVEHYVLIDEEGVILAYAKILNQFNCRFLSELVALPNNRYGLHLINDIFARESMLPIKLEVDIHEAWLRHHYETYGFVVSNVGGCAIEMIKGDF